jgi:hypothetical protein
MLPALKQSNTLIPDMYLFAFMPCCLSVTLAELQHTLKAAKPHLKASGWLGHPTH